MVGNLTLSQIIQRKIDFLFNDERAPIDNVEDMDANDFGRYEALKGMLADSTILTEQEFSDKYLNELKSLKERFEKTPYTGEDEDDYLESYNNTVVNILMLLNPEHEFDKDY